MYTLIVQELGGNERVIDTYATLAAAMHDAVYEAVKQLTIGYEIWNQYDELCVKCTIDQTRT